MKVDLKANTIGTMMNADVITIDGDRVSPSPQPVLRQKTRVLFVATNLRDLAQLAIDEEAREVVRKVRMSDHRDDLDVVVACATRPDDLLQLLNQHRPRIVHFSGHGSSAGALMLSDDRGQVAPVAASALDALFATLKEDVRLVVMNACYSRVQAAAISRNIDFVVGMNGTIGDRAAIVFAAALYGALGFGRSVRQAFDQARVALMLDQIPEDQTPALFVRDGASADDALSPSGAMP